MKAEITQPDLTVKSGGCCLLLPAPTLALPRQRFQLKQFQAYTSQRLLAFLCMSTVMANAVKSKEKILKFCYVIVTHSIPFTKISTSCITLTRYVKSYCCPFGLFGCFLGKRLLKVGLNT